MAFMLVHDRPEAAGKSMLESSDFEVKLHLIQVLKCGRVMVFVKIFRSNHLI